MAGSTWRQRTGAVWVRVRGPTDRPTYATSTASPTPTDRMMRSLDGCAQRREDDQHAPSSQARYQLPTPRPIDRPARGERTRALPVDGTATSSPRGMRHGARGAAQARPQQQQSAAQRALRTPPEAPNLCRRARAGSERGAGAVRAHMHHALALGWRAPGGTRPCCAGRRDLPAALAARDPAFRRRPARHQNACENSRARARAPRARRRAGVGGWVG